MHMDLMQASCDLSNAQELQLLDQVCACSTALLSVIHDAPLIFCLLLLLLLIRIHDASLST